MGIIFVIFGRHESYGIDGPAVSVYVISNGLFMTYTTQNLASTRMLIHPGTE